MRDLDIISEELRLKDEETLDKLLEKMERTVVRANDKKLKPEYVSSVATSATPRPLMCQNINIYAFFIRRIR